MESDLVAYHQKGVQKKDLIAGLCYAVVHNYLNRVVGKRKIGERIMFLGGPSLNKGVVAAFENVLGRGLDSPLSQGGPRGLRRGSQCAGENGGKRAWKADSGGLKAP